MAAMDKALSSMDEAKRKKLEELMQEAAQGKKPAAAKPAAALSRGSSRGPSQPASVSRKFDLLL